MTTHRPSPSESARLLRQRVEMGGGEIFLDGLTREQAIAIARAAAAALPTPAAPGQEASSGAARATTAASGPTPSGAALTTPSVPGRPASSATAQAVPHAGRPAPRESSGEGSGPLPILPSTYDALREVALGCTQCRLSGGRTNVVFSDGPLDARLMVVGEAPGANEDKTGIPFVGAAGKYLDLLLGTVDLTREESVYICNVLKCRPPGNRNPMPDEIEACAPFLKKQIDLVAPQALLAVGSFSAQLLTGREKTALGKLRGQVHSYHGVPLVVTYHPAALLRNPKWARAFWDDLQLLRGLLDDS